MPKKKEIRFKKGFSPGELYGEILVGGNDFEEGQGKLLSKKLPIYVSLCKKLYSFAPDLGIGSTFDEKYSDAIDFLGWDLRAEEFGAALKILMVSSIFIAFIIGIILVNIEFIADGVAGFAPGLLGYLYIFGAPLLIAVLIIQLFQTYPLNNVKIEQRKALTYVPEIIGYMIMSLKLVPNLEKAIEFAAEHGRGKIADDFKQALWDVQLGVYSTLAEAVDGIAYRWGKYSLEFKQALMMVRASVIEDSEAKRYALLDRTMNTLLESIQGKMEAYARDLSQPSTVLFYIGVLLPLILIIIMPIGSAFTGAPLAQPLILAFVYNVLIPGISLFFAFKVIRSRPPTYDPPIIKDDYPGLPKKNSMLLGGTNVSIKLVLSIILVSGLLFGFFLSTQGIPPLFLEKIDGMRPYEDGIDRTNQLVPADLSVREALINAGRDPTYFDEGGSGIVEIKKRNPQLLPEEQQALLDLEQTKFFSKKQNDIAPYNFIFVLLLTIGLMVFIFLNFTTKYKRKIQLEIMSIESEFKDSLYVLASRLGENKPVEEALKHTKEFLPNLKISERIFGKTLENIKMMGMPLRSAIFDSRYGSLVGIPSTVIRGGMQILVDSVQLGVNVAARTLVSLSLQLENSEKVVKMLKSLVADITGMMQTMAMFIAPIVLGITTALQKVVMLTLANIVTSSITESSAAVEGPGLGGSFEGGFGSFLNPDVFPTMATPTQFLLIVCIYVIELVIIMTYFTTKIEEDNDLLFRMNLASSLPVALIAFLISVILSNSFIAGFGG